jgi:WD40 repeat protein/serine/threonine protein kinase/tetratricopeptide (TPR) repeat protein
VEDNAVPVDPERVQAIFLEAAEQESSAGRAAVLDRQCGADAELRERVETLMRAHDAPGAFLESPAADPFQTIEEPTITERTGLVIGPYKLLEQIGEGGFGVVFLAEQTHPVRRKVALKVLKPGMDTRQVVGRFEAERQALAIMDHPNIAKVFDGGVTISGRPYFVMELVKGVRITEFCDQHHLTPRQRLELFVPVCQAVQHAHQKGIIHRDLKPSNILVTMHDSTPVPKIIDFGLAKALGQELTDKTVFTGLAQMVGTPLYMSPEQVGQCGWDIDTRSDIYSLGVLLYELLTGTTPLERERFKLATYEEIRRIIREDDPPKPSMRLSELGKSGLRTSSLASISAQRQIEPAKLTKLVRGELDWIVMKALEKDRNRRYDTANGLAIDLQRYLADEPVQACPPSTAYRFRKFARRNKAALAMAAVIAAALITAVVGLGVSNWWVAQERDEKTQALNEKTQALSDKEKALESEGTALAKAQEQEARANERAEEAKKQQTIAKSQERLARRRLYASQMNLAMQASWSGEWPRVLELLEGQRPIEPGEDLRGFEWFYLWRLCNGGRRVPIGGHERAVMGLAFSPDSRTLASASWDGTVRLWDTATGAERMVMRGHPHGPWAVAYSPDGRLLASSGQESLSLIIWDATTGKPLRTIPHSVASFAFSPDSRLLAGCVVKGERVDAVLWDTTTGAESKGIEAGGNVIGFTADGKSLITFTHQYSSSSEIQCWDLDHARLRYRFAIPGIMSAKLSRDGTRIMASASEGTSVWDAATGERMSLVADLSSARGLALSPDNKFLACGMESRRVAVVSVDTGRPLFEDVHLYPCWTVAFSPDGKLFASASNGGAIHLRYLAPSDVPTALAADGVRALAFSADGRRLFIGNSGRTKIVDVAQGKEIAQLPQTGVTAISADLRTLARAEGDGKLTGWETDSGRVIAEVPLPLEHPWPGLALSLDGKLAATHCPWAERTVRLWDLSTRRSTTLRSDWDTCSVHCAEFSPDGSFLAAGFQFYSVTIWDVASGRVKCEFYMSSGMTNVFSLAWAPDGHTLAAGTDVGYVMLWNTQTGARTTLIRGHALAVRALAFAPDGKTLATGSTDKTIKLWDTVTGQERCTLVGHKGGISKLRFSPDGATLVSASDDGTVRLWRASTATEALARHPAPRWGASTTSEAFQAHQAALMLVHGDKVNEREAIRAIELANKAIALVPGQGTYCLTLAIAHFRAGHWREAITALDESEKYSSSFAQHKLVRAMALWKLDRKSEARTLYEATARQIDQRLAFDEETDRYRAEAAEMLGFPVPTVADALPAVAIDVAKRVQELRRTLAKLDQRPAPPPTDQRARYNLAKEFLRLGWSAHEAGDLTTMEAAGRSSYCRFAELVRDDAPGCRFAFEGGQAADLLGVVLIRSDRKEEALPIVSRASEWLQTAARARLDLIHFQDAAANEHRQLAQLLRDLFRNLDQVPAAVQADRDAEAAAQKASELRKLPQFHQVVPGVRAYIESREWKRAADEFAKGFGCQPVIEPWRGFQVALLLLLADDVDGYAKLVEKMPRQFMSHEWPHDIARTLNLHSCAGIDPATVVTIAQEAARWDSDSRECWPYLNLGLAYYRAGQFEQALKHLTEAPGFTDWRVYWVALAMTHHRLGHAEEARRWLDKAHGHFRETIESAPNALKATMTPYWEDWAYFEVLLREADALIKEKGSH